MKHLYIGGYGPGILTPGGGLTRLASPSFLAAHPTLPVLYAAGELTQGWLTALTRDGDALTPLDERPSAGDSPCHVAVSPDGAVLAAANYGDGTVSLHRLDPRGAFTGTMTVLPHEGSGPNPERQQGPHAHQAVFHDGVLHVSDLGTDEIRRYTPQGEKLEALRLPPGTGPRHMVFSGSRLYVVGELDGIVTCIEGEKSSGTLASRAEGVNQPSHLDLAGEYLYVANRGPNSITVLRADDLSRVAEVPSGGDWPRHFAITGDRLYVANQRSGVVTEFALKDGVPEPTGQSIKVDSPSCVLPLS
ncbi:lactonase family protein [Nonomuraea rhizosphaerae]|uniref:lactonase family protein n=1 Tax=Nonomuraea rhizosphaerae TaxID=2665663 RepID=UPI001C5F49A6|nr:lactonase family protein [Nonomuraea rhizosphaerae]